jgi:hypothetical protein
VGDTPDPQYKRERREHDAKRREEWKRSEEGKENGQGRGGMGNFARYLFFENSAPVVIIYSRVKPRSHCPIRLNSTQLVELSRIGQCDLSYDPIQLNSTHLISTGSSSYEHFGFLSS